MNDHLVAPICPECESRQTKLRFDTDDDIGVVRCSECEEDLCVVSILANQQFTTVIDPMAGTLTDEAYDRLEESGRLPQMVVGDR